MAVDPREKRREGSRRAQAAREKRQQVRQKRKNRNIILAVGGVLAIAVAAVSFAMFGGGTDGPGRVVETLQPLHRPVGSIPIDVYNTNPPSSGPHYDHWHRGGGFVDTPLVVGEVVHNMEHGYVIIWYRPDETGALGAQVRDLVQQMGSQCLLAGPYEDMPWAVAATAWGRILELESFDANQLRDFVNAYRARLGPEAGACRTNP
jgi:hypothetical protein